MKAAVQRSIMGAGLLLAGAVFASACTGADQTAVDRTTKDTGQNATDAYQGLRADGERLVDEVRTRRDPKAKQQLLDTCRNALERLRKANDANAGRVDTFCNSIRDTNPDTSPAWDDIRQQLRAILTQPGG